MIHSFTSLCIGITGGALVYMAAKTVLWWGVTGTLGLLFGQIPLSSWLVRSLKGLLLVLLALAGGVVLAGVACRVTDPFWLLQVLGVVGAALTLRMVWREIITLFGLLSGDWNPFRPKLRFFGWDTGIPGFLRVLHGGLASGGYSTPSSTGTPSGVIDTERRHFKDTYGYCYH